MGNFLMGLGVGLIGGVLFAPKSGSETRRYIVDKTNEGADYVKTKANDLTDAASDLIDKGKEVFHREQHEMAQSKVGAAVLHH
jgi:gas vesicle protein